LHDETILDAACAPTVPMSTRRIKDFLYDFLKDVDEYDGDGKPIICHITSIDLHNHYMTYCNENSILDVENKYGLGTKIGKANIDGCSRNNKWVPSLRTIKSTWTFHVAKVKAALKRTNVSTSVPSTMPPTTTPPTAITAAPTVPLAPIPVLATPVKPIMINIMDDDESEPKFKKTKTESSVRFENLEKCKQYITSDEYDRKKAEIIATI
jgi:hypothetical protein